MFLGIRFSVINRNHNPSLSQFLKFLTQLYVMFNCFLLHKKHNKTKQNKLLSNYSIQRINRSNVTYHWRYTFFFIFSIEFTEHHFNVIFKAISDISMIITILHILLQLIWINSINNETVKLHLNVIISSTNLIACISLWFQMKLNKFSTIRIKFIFVECLFHWIFIKFQSFIVKFRVFFLDSSLSNLERKIKHFIFF